MSHVTHLNRPFLCSIGCLGGRGRWVGGHLAWRGHELSMDKHMGFLSSSLS